MSIRAISMALLVTVTAGGQVITLASQTVNAGTAIFPQVYNDTNTPFWTLTHPHMSLRTGDGDIVWPDRGACSDTLWALNPAATHTTPVSIPQSGPGSLGTHLLLYHLGYGAVAKVHVVAPTPGFPDIHLVPRGSGLIHGFHDHRVPFSAAVPHHWWVGNSGAAAFTFGVGDVLSVYAPGGSIPVSTMSMGGIQIAPGKVAAVPLPIATLTPGPYTVELSWTDPSAGPRVVRHGIRADSHADLHVPSGKKVLPGGQIEAFVGMELTSLSPPGVTPLPTFGVLVGYQPGTTPLPNGHQLPLVLDELAIESLNSGLFGLLANNLGTPPSVFIIFCVGQHYLASGITLAVPNVPALSGSTFRMASFVIDPVTGTAGASQGEDIVIL